jgi:hypothetical protein
VGSWVRIPIKAWTSVCVYVVFVLSCVQVEALRRANPPSDSVKDQETEKAATVQQRAVQPEIGRETKVKMSLCLIKHHAMTYGKWRYSIRNLGTGWWQVVTFTSLKELPVRAGQEEEWVRDSLIVSQKSLLSLLGIEPPFLGRLARRLALKPCEFPRPLRNLSFTTNSPVLSLGLTTNRQRRSDDKIPRISDLRAGPRRTVCFALWSLQTQGKRSRFLYDRELDNAKSAFKKL